MAVELIYTSKRGKKLEASAYGIDEATGMYSIFACPSCYRRFAGILKAKRRNGEVCSHDGDSCYCCIEGCGEYISGYVSHSGYDISFRADEVVLTHHSERLEQQAQDSIPPNYPDLYPQARGMKRHFVLHLGETNSGKTYLAMQQLRTYNSGVYLAPLRLLAYEQFEQLNADGFLCSLVTGEEQDIVEGARFQASTVEMVSLETPYECVVIDECQLIADYDRGSAWTAAILGVCSPVIHLCASPNAKDLLITLIEQCGDTYEVVDHERQTPLVLDTGDYFSFPDDVRPHDALIVFSRRNVHAVAYELVKQGKKCSIVYGNLPYDVRREQARLFAEGKTDVLVATDAIGMGMNLPIERVVFLEGTKYDGHDTRDLSPSEVKQIGGRAGRRGIFDEGHVSYTYEAATSVEGGMRSALPVLSRAVLGFPESLLALDEPLSDTIRRWKKLPVVNSSYVFARTETFLQLVEVMERHTNDKELIYRFSTMPFDEKTDRPPYRMWCQLFLSELRGDVYDLEDACSQFYIKEALSSDKLEDLEGAYKLCDLLYAYFTRFNHPEDIARVLALKKQLSKGILKHLSQNRLSPRKCKYCGAELAWNYGYGMCSDCYRRRYGYYRDYDDDYAW